MYMRDAGGGRDEHDTVMTQTSCILVPHKVIRVCVARLTAGLDPCAMYEMYARERGCLHARSLIATEEIASEIDSLPLSAE